MENHSTHDHSRYFAAVGEAGDDLADALSHVRAEEDSGRIGPLAACAERITLFEQHLARLARLRAEHLGGDKP
jgi:hypothetical protein